MHKKTLVIGIIILFAVSSLITCAAENEPALNNYFKDVFGSKNNICLTSSEQQNYMTNPEKNNCKDPINTDISNKDSTISSKSTIIYETSNKNTKQTSTNSNSFDADLKVSELTATQTSGCTIELTATIENIGESNVDIPFMVKFSGSGDIYDQEVLTANPPPAGIVIDTIEVQGLDAGESIEITVSWQINQQINKFGVYADSTYLINEPDEGNNWKSIPYTALPDLIVSDIEINCRNEYQLEITATVENIGHLDVQTAFIVRFEGSSTCPPIGIVIDDIEVQGLDAGESIEVTTTWEFDDVINELCVGADSTNVVEETDERNNWLEIPFYGPGIPGDLDDDGDVDQSDLGIILSTFELYPGDSHYDERGDINKDCYINQDDLDILLLNYS